jgi:hypothetical protein
MKNRISKLADGIDQGGTDRGGGHRRQMKGAGRHSAARPWMGARMTAFSQAGRDP